MCGKYSHCEKESICKQQSQYTVESCWKQYYMYMLRICWKHCCRVNCAVIVEKYHIVKRKAYINSKASILWRVVVNSTICICWGYAGNIVVELIGQWLWKNIILWKGSICKQQREYTGESHCKQYYMYMLRICCKHWYNVNCAVICEKISHCAKGSICKQQVSILGRVIVNSTLCIFWGYAVNIVVEWIGQ